jgi:hypothetical protein
MDRPALPTPAAVADRLAERIRDLTETLVGREPSQRSDTALRFRSRGSLQVWIAGEKRGKWKDHEDGEFGDALGLVAHLRKTSMKDAYGWAMDWLGIMPGTAGHKFAEAPPRPQERPQVPTCRPPTDSIDVARRIWNEAVEPAGTPVERYLVGRGLLLPRGAPISFHPACPRGRNERLPAMVALMTHPVTGEPCGVHRTFLAPDGAGKAEGQAKMMLGRAGVIRLVPDEEVAEGLGLAEGIETSLAVMQGFEWSPVWAATSAGGISVFPVLPGLEAITVFADADDGGVGMRAATACVKRWTDAGLGARIMIAPPEHDFADLIERAG